MASNDVEVLDPAASVEKLKEIGSERVLNRRHFIAALGVAGAAAGTGLVSTHSAVAQQPLQPTGYNQIDVINLLMNLKYLKATLYVYITTGKDILASTGVTTSTGVLYNAPTQITFSNQQITDLFNEMYYDELNQLIKLRSLQGIATANRAAMNLTGLGQSGTVPTGPTTTTITQSQAIGLARMLEDLSAQACATATIYLTGANLALVNQILAVDASHAGALRLLSIQTGAQYQSTQYSNLATSTTVTPVAFLGSTTTGTGSNQISAYLAALPLPTPAVGNIITGVGVPAGVITAIVGATQFTGTTAIGSTIIGAVSNIANLAVGQTIVGPGIPAGTTITAVGSSAPFTLSVSAPATASGSVTLSVLINSTPIGIITSASKTLTGVSSTVGLGAGQIITGTNIPANTTITGVTANTIAISAAPTATPTAIKPTGYVTSGSNVITSLSSVSGLLVGQAITGTGIPASATITSINSNAPLSITISNNATVTSTVVPTGSVQAGSTLVNLVSDLTSVNAGATITGTGIPAGTTVVSTGTGPNSITMSAPATISSAVKPTGIVTNGSATVTSVSSVASVAIGQIISGAGIPDGTTVNTIGTNTITMSAPATASSGTAVPLSIGIPETVTVTAPVTLTVTGSVLTVGSTTVTLSSNATITGVNTFSVIVPDTQDVVPADVGSGAANGPAAIVGSNPPSYQGFFDTANAATASANSPAGVLFNRSFGQVLAALYNYNSTTFPTDPSQNYEGGFFPGSVSGAINNANS